jgi:hypothetical protein
MKMSYDRIGNWRIREKGQKKKSLFQKVDEIKRDLKEIIPEIEGSKLIEMMSHCRRYYEGKLYYGRRENTNRKPRKLTKNERIVYDYILKNSLNPSTTYRWFLATRLPSDIKEKLARGEIGQNKAMQISANRRRVKQCNEGLLMMEEIRNIIWRL